VKTQEADDQDKRLKREMEIQAHKTKTIREAARRKAEERAEKKRLKAPKQNQMLADMEMDENTKALNMIIGMPGENLAFQSEESSVLSRRSKRSNASKASKRSRIAEDPHALPELTPVGRTSLGSRDSAEEPEEEQPKKRGKRKKKASMTKRMGGHSVVTRAKKQTGEDAFENADKISVSDSDEEDMYTDDSGSQ